jgi:hypothetical protein
MAKFNRYSGDATIQIKKNGTVVVKTTVEYPSLEAAGVHLTTAEITAALNKPVPMTFQFPMDKRKFA